MKYMYGQREACVPDACWAVASRENVPYERLQAAYDEQERNRNA